MHHYFVRISSFFLLTLCFITFSACELHKRSPLRIWEFGKNNKEYVGARRKPVYNPTASQTKDFDPFSDELPQVAPLPQQPIASPMLPHANNIPAQQAPVFTAPAIPSPAPMAPPSFPENQFNTAPGQMHPPVSSGLGEPHFPSHPSMRPTQSKPSFLQRTWKALKFWDRKPNTPPFPSQEPPIPSPTPLNYPDQPQAPLPDGSYLSPAISPQSFDQVEVRNAEQYADSMATPQQEIQAFIPVPQFKPENKAIVTLHQPVVPRNNVNLGSKQYPSLASVPPTPQALKEPTNLLSTQHHMLKRMESERKLAQKQRMNIYNMTDPVPQKTKIASTPSEADLPDKHIPTTHNTAELAAPTEKPYSKKADTLHETYGTTSNKTGFENTFYQFSESTKNVITAPFKWMSRSFQKKTITPSAPTQEEEMLEIARTDNISQHSPDTLIEQYRAPTPLMIPSDSKQAHTQVRNKPEMRTRKATIPTKITPPVHIATPKTAPKVVVPVQPDFIAPTQAKAVPLFNTNPTSEMLEIEPPAITQPYALKEPSYQRPNIKPVSRIQRVKQVKSSRYSGRHSSSRRVRRQPLVVN